jgi:uncharacterized protein
MSKKRDLLDQQNKSQTKSRRTMQIGISFTVIVIALAIFFMQKKTSQDSSTASPAPMFKKQGELTFIKNDGKSIVSIDIEIADDEVSREVGLMGRPVMGERQGMLFVFEEEQFASFWMRNTILPLDMIFINKQEQIVTIQKNTKPFSDESYAANALTMFVLEVNAGFAENYGIKEGYRIRWKKL